jgi:hypothetical protein
VVYFGVELDAIESLLGILDCSDSVIGPGGHVKAGRQANDVVAVAVPDF